MSSLRNLALALLLALPLAAAASQAAAQPTDCPDWPASTFRTGMSVLQSDLARLAGLPRDAVIEEVAGVHAPASEWIRAYVDMVQRLRDCLDETGAEPAGEDGEEAPAGRSTLDFLEYKGGVCVLRSAYCINLEGDLSSLAESDAEEPPAAGAEAKPQTSQEEAGPDSGSVQSEAVAPPASTGGVQPRGTVTVSGRWVVVDQAGTFSVRFDAAGGPIQGSWRTPDGSGTLSGFYSGGARGSVLNGSWSGSIVSAPAAGTWSGTIGADGTGSGGASGAITRAEGPTRGQQYPVSGSWSATGG